MIKRQTHAFLLIVAVGVMQYECHEGNYGLGNILSAARAEEKGAAAK